MAPDLDGDLGVDVLIIGGGIQGLYIAREVAKTYSVCVVTDPKVASATLDVPNLILPAVQVNIRAGKLPPADADGVSYLRVPVNVIGRPL